ncbi:sensor histidine kinase [Paenibacillus sediminis]|uniref:histidine kinase n=1 Tax=Paenibacillus sediminis TaxID=664909 RepID=A0ABS4H0U1_9BACL|nr:HAMP domain-containing sensor histidine kinase [Paenibacillus sediminis]MBP1936101.1 signal transduction histidine kinase [Paenibacillus sediminis]
MNNVILILTILIVTSLSFHAFSERYLINEAKRQMKADAEAIALSFKGTDVLSNHVVAERMVKRAKLKLVGQAITSQIIITDRNNKILYTNADKSEIRALLGLNENNNKSYLVERRRIQSENGQLLGNMLLAIQIKDVNGLNRLLRGAQLASLLIGGLIAIAMGYVLGGTITKPIHHLAKGMRNFSVKKKMPQITVHTQDEIRDLAESFTEMASKLQMNDRMQTEFLQNASHELKTPLMTIQGNAEAIKDGLVQGIEAEQSLDLIVSECQRLKGVVDELIYMTRLEHSSDQLHFEVMKIGDVIGDALNLVQGLADQRSIDLILNGDLQAEGQFDREKLIRVFLNIVGNGIRYAKSSVRLNVTASSNQVEIICMDDGRGFAPGEEQKVFGRFYKGEQGGTGIGLAIAKAIIEAHGGTIEARRGTPSGAVFRLSIPLRSDRNKGEY